MITGIKSIKSRLQKLEKKAGLQDAQWFYDSLSNEQLDAIVDLSYEIIISGHHISDEEAFEYLMDYLDCDEEEARYLWKTPRGNLNTPDPELDHLSEEELIEYVHQTKQDIDDLRAGAYGLKNG